MKRVIVLFLVMAMVLSFSACGKKKDSDYSEIQWPKSEAGKIVPVPESNFGKIQWESSDDFLIYIGNTSIDQYKSYVDKCIEAGFNVDYYRGDKVFYANNKDGWSLDVTFNEDDVMHISVDKQDEDEEVDDGLKDKELSSEESEEVESSTESSLSEGVENKEAAPSEEIESKPTDESKIDESVIRPEVKEALDSYELFMTEYVDFMKKYNQSKDPMSLMNDFNKYMAQYSETMEKINAMDQSAMTTAEITYFTEVQARVLKVLSEIQ